MRPNEWQIKLLVGGDRLEISYYIPIIVVFIVLFILLRNQKSVIAKKVIKKRKTEEKTEMIELAKIFIGKECLIYAFDSNHQFSGTIKEVSDGAILIENNGSIEAVNLDFVIRIREYPKNKKGKKKSVVLD
jgi:hypothetical protein